ncbi:MAG: hypothetical protein ACFB21_00295 [Opitutales bacterium]
MILAQSGVRDDEAGPTGSAVALTALLCIQNISINLPTSPARGYELASTCGLNMPRRPECTGHGGADRRGSKA